MKSAGIERTTTEAQQGAPVSADGRTRQLVCRLLLESGPTRAAGIAEKLGLSQAAVRRHLDALVADGEVTSRDAPTRGRRGRGRPARQFLLTEAGRARFGHAYDDLAVSALRFLAEHGGPEAVREFAERRVAGMVDAAQVLSGEGPERRTEMLAEVLTKQGYAASAEHVGSGAQLCQHHCPVAHVASEFPELCEAETEAFAELLGTHVQRLATIARGDAACTTHVPSSPRLRAGGGTATGEPTSRGPRTRGADPVSPDDGGKSP